MTFLAPLFLAAAGLAAAGTVILHLLSVRRPQPFMLPTARFAPQRSVRAASFARRPTDLLLMALRVMAILLIGAAFARPVWLPERAAERRVILVDRSAAAASDTEVLDSVRAVAREGDLLLAFADTLSELRTVVHPDSVLLPVRSATMGNLTAALVAGVRAAATLRDSAERVELVLVSPLVAEAVDAATLAVRAEWPGMVRLVRTGAATPDSARHLITVSAPDDDPVAAGAALAGRVAAAAVHVERGAEPDVSSSAGVLVHWPVSGIPDGWTARATPDTVGGVTADAASVVPGEGGSSTLVAPFVRLADAPPAQDNTRALAWWPDGEVAALERMTPTGCVREVGIEVPEGDVVLRPSFARFLAALATPCGGHQRSITPLADSSIALLAGTGEASVGASRSEAGEDVRSPLTPWLLSGALALLLAELLVRRSGTLVRERAE